MLAPSLIVLSLLAASASAAPASSSSTASAASSSSSSAPAYNYTLTAKGFTSKKWIDGFEKARAVVAKLTLEEKINYTALVTDTKGCSGLIAPIKSAGIRGVCMGDGPSGPNSRYSTQYPTEVTSGATWDRDLWTARAEAMGKEYHDLGVSTPLSIVAGGPIGRSPYGGRNWENWSPDPFLTGEATRRTVEAFQQEGVTGLMKHFYGNEQEYLRIGNIRGGYFPAQENLTLATTIDAATTRELYSYAFTEGIRSGAGAVMCSYNKVNGVLACENDEVLAKLLKEELNFNGWVVTDWTAAHSTIGAAVNGSDYVESNALYGAALGDLINNGTLPANIIDDKITRILTPYFALDQDKLPEVDFDRYVASDDAANVVRKIAEGSITLLKNSRGANNTRGLPLNKPKDLILVGSAAAPAVDGIVGNRAGAIYYNPTNEFTGFNADGFGSGGSPAPYAIDPFQAISARGRKEKRPVVVDGYFRDNATAGSTSVPGYESFFKSNYLDYKLAYASSTVVFVSATAMEGYDRTTLSLANGGDELIKYVASAHNDTTVVISAPGQVDMSQWIDHPNVTAVLFTYFPTSEGGNALASVLFGDINPSGKLPFTIAKNVSDYDTAAHYNETASLNPTTNFTEGVMIDYRYFDNKNTTPLYEFGFGLSYTTFSFSDLKIASNKKSNPALVRETNEKFFVNGKETVGLYDYVYTVKATVKNTGSVAGAEVAQMYLSFPNSTPRKMPVRQLRGFAKEVIKPGSSQTVSFNLRNKDLAYYSTVLGGWTIPSGDFTVTVGSSSRKLPLTGKITV